MNFVSKAPQWGDLEKRGVSNIDVPALILGIGL